jgi:hypothetical protein
MIPVLRVVRHIQVGDQIRFEPDLFFAGSPDHGWMSVLEVEHLITDAGSEWSVIVNGLEFHPDDLVTVLVKPTLKEEDAAGAN